MKLSKNFLTHKAGNDTVIVPTGNAGFSGVVQGNETLGVILDLLKEDTTEQQIINKMAEQYDALMNKATFDEIIERDGRLIYTNKGDSMLPLIKEGRDLLVIEKTNGRLKRFDVPLYKRDTGQYVLHRIVKVRQNDYVICGDNRANMEYGITDRHIIGVLTAVIRNGKELSVNSTKYKLYVYLWYLLFPFRFVFIKAQNLIRRIKKKR